MGLGTSKFKKPAKFEGAHIATIWKIPTDTKWADKVPNSICRVIRWKNHYELLIFNNQITPT